MGAKLVSDSTMLAEAEGRQIGAAATLALEYPVQVEVTEWNPLPDGVTNASLPMFYALIVILAGFTGAMIISNLLDARLGFIPLEIGPLALHVHVAPFGRLQTIVRKWAVTVATAPLVSALCLWVADIIGVTGYDGWDLFWFSNLVIISVGCAPARSSRPSATRDCWSPGAFRGARYTHPGGATPPRCCRRCSWRSVRSSRCTRPISDCRRSCSRLGLGCGTGSRSVGARRLVRRRDRPGVAATCCTRDGTETTNVADRVPTGVGGGCPRTDQADPWFRCGCGGGLSPRRGRECCRGRGSGHRWHGRAGAGRGRRPRPSGMNRPTW